MMRVDLSRVCEVKYLKVFLTDGTTFPVAGQAQTAGASYKRAITIATLLALYFL